MEAPLALKGLLLQLTRKCPLECSHCYISASPSETETLDSELIEQAITSYARFENAKKTLAVTGGEPFLRRAHLERAVRIGSGLGFFVHVNTSAFFGTTGDNAQEYLTPVREINQLEVSVDREHLQFVNLSQIKNVTRAAFDLGMAVQLAIQLRDESAPFVEELTQCFPNLTLYRQNFAPVGSRNTELESHPDRMPTSLRVGCGKVGSIFINELGSVFPCTSAVVASLAYHGDTSECFSLGNLHQESLADIIPNIGCERLRLVKSVGPTLISEMAGAPGKEHVSYCHECVDLARNAWLESAPQKVRRAIKWTLEERV